MYNFISTFEELDKLYEELEITENFDNDNGVTAWSKNVIDLYTQAAEQLGLSDYTMTMTRDDNGKDIAVITATKNGKKLFAEEPSIDETHNVKNIEDAKEVIKFLFPDLTESCKEALTEAAEDEVVEEEIPVDEEPVEEPAAGDEPRQLICECDKCGALVIKAESDIIVDEESNLVNVEDECQFCEEANGYKIIGVMMPYEVAEEAPVEETLAEDEFVEESIKTESKDDELEEIFDIKPSVNLSLDGGQGNDVSVLGH